MNTTKGFTLIEVLIAMLVLAIGLLGMATLQTYTLRSNLAAYNRGQATQLLYDMADRMRGNNCKATTFVTCGAAPVYLIANSNTLGATVNTVCTTANNPTGCTPVILAGNDLIEWNNAIAATLPMGRGCITTANGAFNLYITWDDDRSGVVTTDIAVPTGCAATFSTYNAPVSGTFHDPVFTLSMQL